MTKNLKSKTKPKRKLGQTAATIAALENKLAKLAVAKRNTPYTNAGGNAGKWAGGWVGMPDLGRTIGRFLGAGIGSIYGSGDYKMTGTPANYNVLSGSIPQFSSNRATNVVCHREFLGNVNGTTAFTNTAYPLQPGIGVTFPWLSPIAGNYQEYRIHGMMFEFNPLITDFVTSGAPGVIVMATNYNADAPIYTSKVAMENSEYAVAVKPTEKLVHMIECEQIQTVLPNRYVRTGTVGANQDLRLYDWGNFQFATQGNPVQLLGEIWVTYCIEFFKPVLPISNAVGSVDKYQRANTSGTSFFGAIQAARPMNEIGTTISGTDMTIPPGGSLYYEITAYHLGVAAVIGTIVPAAVSNCIIIYNWSTNSIAVASAPQPGATSISYVASLVIGITDPSLPAVFRVPNFVVPTTSTVDVMVVPLGDLLL